LPDQFFGLLQRQDIEERLNIKPYESSIKHLRDMKIKKSPTHKLKCIKQMTDSIKDAVNEFWADLEKDSD
jgi:hypothetical protein